MIAIVNYGVGNLFSLSSSLSAIGQEVTITSNPEDLKKSERIILPGVGAFGDAARKLFESGLAAPLIEEAKAGKKILGICVGMQLLFSKSYEFGEHEGLNLIPGEVRYIGEVIPAGLKIPQIGWNDLRLAKSPFFKSNPTSFKNNPLASKLALWESNPPVSKLTSPLTQGGRESPSRSSIFSTLLPPLCKGRWPTERRSEGLSLKRGGGERSEPEGLWLKKRILGDNPPENETPSPLAALSPFTGGARSPARQEGLR